MNYGSPSLAEILVQQQYQRSFQLGLRTFKEAELIKKTTISQRVSLLTDQYQQKFKVQLMNKQIRKSLVLNEERMLLMNQDRLINELFLQVKQQIQFSLRSDINKYKLFLIGIITQGIVRMFEQKLLIRCLQEDQKIVQQILGDCIESFHGIMNYQLGRKYQLELEVDKNNYLMPLPKHKLVLQKQEQLNYSIGGVILTSKDGNIAYKNTIDCRVNILKQLALPDVRAEVWEWEKIQNQEQQTDYTLF